MKQVNQRDAEHYIAQRLEFRASALEGKDGGALSSSHRLSQAEANLFINTSEIDYTVYSYNTPIAWHSPKGWYVVEQKFSVTTSKHQNLVRRAISNNLVVAQ